MGLLATAALLSGPGLAGAAAAEGAAGGAGMTLEFARATARVAGPGAIVGVKCVGAAEGECAGTVTLTLAGVEHEAPFSLAGGTRQNLVVPLEGEHAPRRGETALGVAETAQPLGAYALSSETLHFR